MTAVHPPDVNSGLAFSFTGYNASEFKSLFNSSYNELFITFNVNGQENYVAHVSNMLTGKLNGKQGPPGESPVTQRNLVAAFNEKADAAAVAPVDPAAAAATVDPATVSPAAATPPGK